MFRLSRVLIWMVRIGTGLVGLSALGMGVVDLVQGTSLAWFPIGFGLLVVLFGLVVHPRLESEMLGYRLRLFGLATPEQAKRLHRLRCRTPHSRISGNRTSSSR